MSLSLRMTNFAFDKAVNLWGLSAALLSPVFNLSPLVFRIRITNRCNLSCHYCYVGQSLNQKVENPLTREEWGRITSGLSRKTLIDITGGEPLLTPGFDEIITDMLDKKLKVSLITNGTVYKESLFKKFVDKKLSHFMISFDGNEMIHDEVRGKGNFARAIRSAEKIIEYKKNQKSKLPLVVAKITYTENNYHDLEKLIDNLVNRIGFDGVTINLLFDNEARNGFADGKNLADDKFWSGNRISFDAQKIKLMAQEMEKIFQRFSGKIQLRPEIKISEVESYFSNPSKFSPTDCHKYRSIITMYSDGTMTPCDLGLDVGNIRSASYSISKIATMSEIKEFFKSFKKQEKSLPGCQGCCLKKHESVA